LIGELPARRCGVSDRVRQETQDLLQVLAQVPDPRDPRGRIHPLPGLPAIAAAAVAAGQSTLTEIAEWATDLPDAVLARPGAARDPFTGLRLVPDDSTFARVLAGVDADALDTAICQWLIARQAENPGPAQRVIAVDGKTLRGSGRPGAPVHLLATIDQRSGVVLGQTDVDGKSNELLRSRATSWVGGKGGLVGPVDAV
jgi:DDE_Tnp_1-associated